MTEIDIDKERESDDKSVSHDESHESDKKYEKYGEFNGENYEAYETKSSQEQAAYKETGQAVEVVYDRCDSDYGAEEPG